MIRRRASAVLRLRDGLSGRILPGGAYCQLDGQPLRRPLWKEGGYLVLQDLAPGPHELLLRQPGFEPLRLTVTAGRDLWEQTLDLCPAAGYPLPPDAVQLTLRVAGAPDGETVWLGMSGDVPLKLAQDRPGPEERCVRLFCQGPESRLPAPAHYLLADAKGPEVAFLHSLRDGVGELERPLALPHRRGVEWVWAQPRTLAGGAARMLFARPGVVWLYCRGALARAETAAGSYLWEVEEGR